MHPSVGNYPVLNRIIANSSGGSRGVPWVPWNPSFEGLPSKLLCANILCTLLSHWSYALQVHSSNNACVSTQFSCIKNLTCACPRCTYILPEACGNHRYNMSEASERTKAKVFPRLTWMTSCFAASVAQSGVTQLGMAICYQYESASFPAPYTDDRLLCSLCGPKWGHAFNATGNTAWLFIIVFTSGILGKQ